MRIDLNCPIEIWRIELPSEKYNAIGLMMYNLCDRIVISAQITLSLRDESGHELQRLIHRAHDLDGRPQTAFSMNIPLEKAQPKLVRAECTISKVWFSDNSVWRHTKGSSVEYTPNGMKSGRDLDALRHIAGKAASGYPEEQENVWLCVCGRPNAKNDDICRRCHQPRAHVFAQFNREAVQTFTRQQEQQLALSSKAALEKTSMLQQQREQQFMLRRKKRNRAISSVAGVVAVGVLGYAAIFHGLPYLNYYRACQAMNAGLYEKAITAFEAMTDYRDASTLLPECRYRHAVSCLNKSTTAESYRSAAAAFGALGDYLDSAEQKKAAEYQAALLLLDDGKTSDAAAIFDALGDYSQSRDRRKACDYTDASVLLSNGEYERARSIFLSLGTWQDAADKASECLYLPGVKALENNDPDGALALLKQVQNYSDSAQKIKQAYFRKGVDAQAQGSLVDAAEYYLLADDYDTAARKANDCLYRQAESSRISGDLLTAVTLYQRIPGYQDADAQYQVCALSLARTSVKDKEYQRAITLLKSLPEGYEDRDSLLQATIYESSADAYTRGDYQTAVDGYASLGNYKASPTRLTRARYKLANELQEKKDYPAAIEQFSLLGKYEDSRARLRASRYALGNQLMEEQKWHEAAQQFSHLSNYKDAQTRWKEATWQEAESLFAAGDYSPARTLYASVGRYNTARNRMHDCDYAAAEVILSAGDTLSAAQAFANANWKDSSNRAAMLFCQLADEALNAGNVLYAGQLYARAGNWEDANEKATQAFDSLFGEAAALSRTAMDEKRYADAVTALCMMDLTYLPESYADLSQIWLEANYQEGLRLYRADEHYKALPYFDAVRGYRDTDTILTRSCYRIIGTWATQKGQEYVFSTDGTCSLNGEKLFFSADTYALNTGSEATRLSTTHKITTVNDHDMTLRDIRDGNNFTIRLYRVEESLLSESDESSPVEASADHAALPAPGETLMPLPGAAPTAAPKGGDDA